MTAATSAHDVTILCALEFERSILTNPVNRTILQRVPELDLPNWRLTAGCLFQTVWNEIGGFEPTYGIRDYDLFYFDGGDLSWEAEDEVIRRCAAALADVDAEVEVRNQARVHLWYEDRFGVRSEPFRSVEDGIRSFQVTGACVAVSTAASGPRTYAPFGLNDVFGMVVRPNPLRGTRESYEAKTKRWAHTWPGLTVLPWRPERDPRPTASPRSH